MVPSSRPLKTTPRRSRRRFRRAAAALALVFSFGGAGAVVAAAPATAAPAHVSVSAKHLKKLKAKTPTVHGTAAIGATLTAKPGKWTPKTKFHYRWYLGAKAIKGATKVHYVVVAADAGKKLKVKVTGTKKGFATVSRTSHATKPVPAPAPTGDPYVNAFGAFTPFTVSGTGPGVVSLPSGVTYGMISAQYTGEDNFIVTEVDSSGQEGYSDINAIGAYTGTAAFGVWEFPDPTTTPTSLEVTADSGASWTITVSPLSDAPALPASGTGDGVFRYDGPSTTWTMTSDGGQDVQFAVTQYTTAGAVKFLADGLGAFNGQQISLAGPSIVVIQGAGEEYPDDPTLTEAPANWTISQ